MTAVASAKTVELYTWVRTERELRGLSQAKLSLLTGFEQWKLSKWEHGKAAPNDIEEQTLRAAFAKHDVDKETGGHVEYMAKTKWSKAYAGSTRSVGKIRSINLDASQRFAEGVQGHWSHKALLSNGVEATRRRAVSLFSGCGGLTAGFAYSGFDVLAHVELDPAARAVYRYNFPKSAELGSDIRSIENQQLTELLHRSGPVDVVFGGPPCQGFSLTGKRDVYDPRNQLYREFARVVEVLSPQVFVLENVRLLTSMRTPDGNLLIRDVYDVFSRIGYDLVHSELNAMNYGVPQSRERVIFVGVKKGAREPSLPPEEYGFVNDEPTLFPSKSRVRTVRDAIGDLEILEFGEASESDPLHFAVSHPTHVIEMLRDVPEGKSAHENPDPAKRPSSGYNTTYKRMEWDQPASTVTTNFGMISGSRNVHPTSTRSLTIREAARCQSFPDDFTFFGSIGEVRTMIGNAVPPMFAKAIAEHVRKQLIR